MSQVMLLSNKIQQVLGGRTIAFDRLQRRAPHKLMLGQPAVAQLGNRDRLEAQQGRSADFQLSRDLTGDLPCCVAVWPDARLESAVLLSIAEIPAFAAQIPAPSAMRKGLFCRNQPLMINELPLALQTLILRTTRHFRPCRTPKSPRKLILVAEISA
jgi:hypothetical protein